MMKYKEYFFVKWIFCNIECEWKYVRECDGSEQELESI